MVIVLGRRNWDYLNFFGPTADSLLSPPARPNIFNDKSVTDIFYDISTLLILRHILARGTKLPQMPVGSIFPTHIIYVGFYVISWNDIPFELIFTAYPAFEVPEKVGAVYIFVYVSISKGGPGGGNLKVILFYQILLIECAIYWGRSADLSPHIIDSTRNPVSGTPGVFRIGGRCYRDI